MERKQHWDKVYGERAPDQVSWYQKEPKKSLKLIAATGVGHTAALIDVGGGASVLADRLLASGFTNLTVLDISGKALAAAQNRLGSKAGAVRWAEADITEVELPEAAFDVWHDRAVFHFLTKPEDRREYLDRLRRSLKPGGHLIIATFSLAGPPKCSGLDVARYSSETLSHELGKEFKLIESAPEIHQTPFDTLQKFVYCRFSRTQ